MSNKKVWFITGASRGFLLGAGFSGIIVLVMFAVSIAVGIFVAVWDQLIQGVIGFLSSNFS